MAQKMHMRDDGRFMLMALVIYMLLSQVIGAGLSQARAADKPNIIIIMADDLGWNDVGYHGS